MVHLNVPGRAEPPADLRDPRYQQKVVRAMSREWGPHLSYREYRMLAFIIDHTICWARTTYRFTYRCFEEGTTVSAGIGIKETQAREDLKTLAGKGFIAVKRTQNGLEITPDPEWKPMGRPAPQRIAAEQPSGTGGPDPLEPEVQTLRNRSPLLEEHLEEQDRGTSRAIGSAGTARSDEPTSSTGPKLAVPSQIRHRTRPTTSVDDIQRQLPLGDCVQVTTAGAPNPLKAAVAAAKLKAQRELKNPGSLVKTWAAAWSEVYAEAGATAAEWNKVELGMLNKGVIAKWKGSTAELHEFVDWSVREWAMLRVTEFGWMKRDPAPLTPTIRFFLHFAARFVAAFNKREVDRAMSGLNSQERYKRDLMIKRGASAEEADREIARGQAMGMLRDEIAEGKAAARRIEREAAATLITNEKRNREHLRRVQRIMQPQSAVRSEPMRYLSPEELQQTLEQVSNFTAEPFDEQR